MFPLNSCPCYCLLFGFSVEFSFYLFILAILVSVVAYLYLFHKVWLLTQPSYLYLQEYEIDKTLGIKGPEDVAKMGIAEYNKQCRAIVMRYSTEWKVCWLFSKEWIIWFWDGTRNSWSSFVLFMKCSPKCGCPCELGSQEGLDSPTLLILVTWSDYYSYSFSLASCPLSSSL